MVYYALPCGLMQILVNLGPNTLENKHPYNTTNPIYFLESSWDTLQRLQVRKSMLWPKTGFILVPQVSMNYFGHCRGDIGKWIAFVAVVLRLFFPRRFPGTYNACFTISMSFCLDDGSGLKITFGRIWKIKFKGLSILWALTELELVLLNTILCLC